MNRNIRREGGRAYSAGDYHVVSRGDQNTEPVRPAVLIIVGQDLHDVASEPDSRKVGI